MCLYASQYVRLDEGLGRERSVMGMWWLKWRFGKFGVLAA
jgi:hypothetical protein